MTTASRILLPLGFFVLVATVVVGVGASQTATKSAQAASATPTNLTCVNQSGNDQSPGISPSGSELFKGAVVGGGNSSIYVSQSQPTVCPWTAPVAVGSLNSGQSEHSPDLTGDGLTIYFISTRLSGGPWQDLFYATRPAISSSDNWSAPIAVSELNNAPYNTAAPSVSPDNLGLFFESDRPGGAGVQDIWFSTRISVGSRWDPPVPVAELNSASADVTPDISADGKTIFFASNRPGGSGQMDLWGAYRPSMSLPFGPPRNLGPDVNSPVEDVHPSVASDGRTIYFQSSRAGGLGGSDIWVVTLDDTDSDGVVDPLDNCPSTFNPLQDGTVECPVAHWPFDGNFDDVSSNGHHGTPVGDPAFVPGVQGQALDVSEGKYLTVADSPLLDGMTELTIDLWMYTRSYPSYQAGIVDKWGPGGPGDDSYEILVTSSGTLAFAVSDGRADEGITTRHTRDPLPLNTWVHVTATWRAPGDMHVYWDGVETPYAADVCPSCGEDTQEIQDTSQSLWINRHEHADTWGGWLDGMLDEVKIYANVVPPEPPTPTPTPSPTPTPNPEFDRKITILLSFFQLNGSEWDADALKASLLHVNAVWNKANIEFTWPTELALHAILDPSVSTGGKGDVSGLADAQNVCNVAGASRDGQEPGTYPVVLAAQLTNDQGEALWGWAPSATLGPFPVGTSLCVLLDEDTKGAPAQSTPEPKQGETFAHELGHVLCLSHTHQDEDGFPPWEPDMKTDPNDTTNLMHPTEKPTGNQLTKQQMRHARECASELLGQISCPDVTGDGRVNVRDLLDFVLTAFRLRVYEPKLDFNQDGSVNVQDLLIIVRHFGDRC